MKAFISRLRLSPILLIGCLLILPGTTASASAQCSDPILVDASATGTGSGTSWADAMTSLQDGLAAAVTCASTEVWVAAGTYNPDHGIAQTPGDRFATFQLINGVDIYGGFSAGLGGSKTAFRGARRARIERFSGLPASKALILQRFDPVNGYLCHFGSPQETNHVFSEERRKEGVPGPAAF